MTEERAILQLRYRIDTATSLCGKGADGKAYEDMEMAIKALEEIQQYRAIGTLEECREAVERKMPQKPKRKVLDKDLKIGNVTFKAGTRAYLCPSCGKGITGSDVHCRWCGQAILWESDDER